MALLPLSTAAQELLLPLQRSEVEVRRMTKSGGEAVRLPFFDDFAAGFNDTLWQISGGATHSVDVSPLAPTVGVATFDALDANGDLYAHAATTLFPADTLTSRPLRLEGLSVTDSVVLSFFYLPGGGMGDLWQRMGDTPDPQDSLYLDFYRASDSTWINVWCTAGVCVDTLVERTGRAWQYVALPIREDAWLDSSFCFRFRNRASLEASAKTGKAGNGDFWHVDYVLVDRGRDTAAVFRDVAFAAPAPSLLHTYRAMPYRQFDASQMATALDMKIVNLFSSPLATQYAFSVLDADGQELYRYDGGFENAPAQAYQTEPMHAAPTVGYTFPPMTAPTEYTVVHVVREGTGGDARSDNDTVRYRQLFGDYLAYDDGAAENGYGLTSTASQLFLAYRFDLTRTDTLTAVDMFFNRTLADGNAAVPFYISVWSVDDEGMPGDLLYRDESRRFPAFGGFHRYILEHPLTVGGSIFVGFEQSGNDYINLGFDRSKNTADRIWYLTGTEWQQSILAGSLMLRPCFGIAASVGIADKPQLQGEIAVYPNPASERVFISGSEGGRVMLYDMQGRLLFDAEATTINVSSLLDGIYLIRVVTADGRYLASRLIIKH